MIYALVLVALCAYCWVLGADHIQTQWAEERQTQVVHLVHVQASQAAAVVIQHTQIVYRDRLMATNAALLSKDTPHEIPANACPLPGGFRLQHDAAVAGASAPAAVDAAPVPVADATSTILANYAGCSENAKHLSDWEDWYRTQQQILQQ